MNIQGCEACRNPVKHERNNTSSRLRPCKDTHMIYAHAFPVDIGFRLQQQQERQTISTSELKI